MADNNQINKVTPPALPIPPASPLLRYLSDLNNVLRLFFNTSANTLNLLTGSNGGRFIDVPNALYFSTADQAIAVVDTPQVVTFNNTYLENGFELNGASSSQITATYNGVYNFQFIGQVSSGSASAKNIFIWITRDGTDLGYTAREYVLSGSGDIHEVIWNFNLDLAAGEYIEMKWVSDDIDTSLEAVAPAVSPATPHPGVTSAVLTVNFISVLPDVRPTPP